MADEVPPGTVRLACFLGRYGRGRGRSQPPTEFGDLTLREIYGQYFERLGGEHSFEEFVTQIERLRRGTVRRRGGDGRPYPEVYPGAMTRWESLSRQEQWADLQGFRTVPSVVPAFVEPDNPLPPNQATDTEIALIWLIGACRDLGKMDEVRTVIRHAGAMAAEAYAVPGDDPLPQGVSWYDREITAMAWFAELWDKTANDGFDSE